MPTLCRKEDEMFEVWASTLNTPSKCRIKTDDVKKAKKVLDRWYKSLSKLKGEISVLGQKDYYGGRGIVGYWYSDRHEQPIHGRHHASHPDYRLLFDS